jgi:sugar phosphate isomerase/epimerase
MRSDDTRNLSRRQVLAAGLSAAGALTVGRVAGAAPSPADSPYGPFKMGIQSYSLRAFDRTKALALTKELGLHYWESYPAHVPTTTDPAEIARLKQQIGADGVTVIGYGVVHFGKDHAANKRHFEFAKAMGLGYMSADPDPDSFDYLDKLVEEYGVAIGIHNHGPDHRYGKIDTIAAAIKDHNPKIGCCVDTGHFLRSREDPVRAVEVFGTRTFGVHLKDVKDAEKFTVLGNGDLRTAELLKALARIKYEYCLALEYEENEKNPMDDLRACLATVHKAASTLKNG